MYMCIRSVLASVSDVRAGSDGFVDADIMIKKTRKLEQALPYGEGSKFISYPDRFIGRRHDILQ